MKLSPVEDYTCPACGKIALATQGGDFFCCSECGSFLNVVDRRQCFQCGEMRLMTDFTDWRSNRCNRCENLWDTEQKVVENDWTARLRTQKPKRI